MDTQILADRLAALEAHLLQLDQKLDAIGNPGEGVGTELLTLREEITGWRAETAERLGSLEGRLTSAEQTTLETLEREAELLETLAEAVLPEKEPEPENDEQTPDNPGDQGSPDPITPEPEQSPSTSRRWWETILGG